MHCRLLPVLFVVFCIPFLISATTAPQKPQPKILADQLSLLWIVEERIDGEVTDLDMLQHAMQADLHKIGFRAIKGTKAKAIAKQCDIEAMMKDSFCEAIGPTDADIVFVATVDSTAKVKDKQRRKKAKTVGYQVKVQLKMFRVDEKREYGSLTQSSYAKAGTASLATQEALKKIVNPMTMLISIKTHATMSKENVAQVFISGLPSKDHFDHMLLHFPLIDVVSEARVRNLDPEKGQVSLVFSGTTVAGLSRAINKSYGVGLKTTVVGPMKLEATYSPSHSFAMLSHIYQIEDKSGGQRVADAAKLKVAMREQINALWRYSKVIDTGTDTYSPRHATQFFNDYGGELIVTGTITRTGDVDFLELVAKHYNAGEVGRVKKSDPGNIDDWARLAVIDLGNEILRGLDRRTNRLPQAEREQYKAYRNQ